MDGMKFDGGKLRWDLLPLHLIEKVVEVYTFGAQKYAPNSWQKLEDGYNRYKAALFRHLTAHEKGETIDPESKLSHLAHCAWNAIAMMHFGTIERPTAVLESPTDIIEPPIEFKFQEGQLVTPKECPGRGYEILSRKYIINNKVAYFCKFLGWMTESELLRYDPSEEYNKEKDNETTTIHQER